MGFCVGTTHASVPAWEVHLKPVGKAKQKQPPNAAITTQKVSQHGRDAEVCAEGVAVFRKFEVKVRASAGV